MYIILNYNILFACVQSFQAIRPLMLPLEEIKVSEINSIMKVMCIDFYQPPAAWS